MPLSATLFPPGPALRPVQLDLGSGLHAELHAQITLFDATTLERCLSLTGTPATAAVTYLAFSADSSLLLATAVEDSSPPISTFHLWDWANFTTPRCRYEVKRVPLRKSDLETSKDSIA